MSSLIEGYNYDIFISYRQKDNKGDHWVSEFVESLKTELESTFKEEISVYFDINPHDGLLETHDVGESLKEKLKCLIFIPIVSRTYCDPKSFAWEHEFRAFVEMASKDQFGLKVKLPNGNVAGRVLPVIIHDLDKADTYECETLLGGVLRGIEFIYKESGVNRPLMPAEAHPDNNFNKTIYRNQINKVANSIKEILSGLSGDYNTGTNEKIVRHEKLQGNTVKKILIGLLIFLIIGTGVSLIFLKISKPHLFTKDLIALNFYESGKEYFDKYIRTKNRVTLITAASSFRKALSRDPAFAEAYVGLAAVAYRNSNADDISKSDYLDSVMILCNQAISINSHISDAYVYLGFYYRDLNQIQKSEAQFNTALKQDPENFLAFIGLGILYQEIDPVKSVINLQKAISLDDGSYRLDLLRALAHEYRITGFNDKAKVIYNEIYKLDHEYGLLNYRLAVNEYSIGNYSESLNYALKAYVEDSTNTDFISWIGYSYFLIRDFKNSMKYNNMLIPKLNPESLLWNLHRIAYCYYQTGLKEKGDSCLNRMFESLKNLKDLDRYTGDINRTYYDLACAYAVRGDKEKEIQNLKLYFTQSFINLDYLTSLKKDPLLDNIRDDDEYKRLVTEMDQKFRIQHEQIRKWLENNNFL